MWCLSANSAKSAATVAGLSAVLFGLAIAAPTSTASSTPPAEFTASPKTGPGGTRFRDYPHFRVYNAPNDSIADATAHMLESAYSCFVDGLGWRSTGLSFNKDPDTENNGPWYKLNVYRVDDIPGAAANTGTDQATGLSFLNVVTKYLTEPSITVHEYGHALTYAASVWINQTKTGAWWETVAQFVADTFITSPVCRGARGQFQQPESTSDTMMDLKKVLGDAYQAIVDATRSPARGEPSANYYQAWPFFVYLFYNPDDYAPLRNHSVFLGMWTQYKRNSDETPLHVLERIVKPAASIQQVVGRYWARMAFVDIGHPTAQKLYLSQRKSISYAVLDTVGQTSSEGTPSTYRVKPSRQPRYMGANILPLRAASRALSVAVNITAANNAPYTATLVTRSVDGRTIRYASLLQGTAQTTVAAGDEVSLVVANTPAQLLSYDPFNMPAEANRGLDYQVQIIGATFAG